MRLVLCLSLLFAACGAPQLAPVALSDVKSAPSDVKSAPLDPSDTKSAPVAPSETLSVCQQGVERFSELAALEPPGEREKLAEVRAKRGEAMAAKCGTLVPAAQACFAQAPDIERWMLCLDFYKYPEPESGAVTAGQCLRPGGFGPLNVNHTEYAQRVGAAATHFSKLPEAPVQTCGTRAFGQYMLMLRCDDDSKPFTHPMQVATSRVGNIGAGGQCNSIIDAYRVKCPEREYSIQADSYWCLAGQPWR